MFHGSNIHIGNATIFSGGNGGDAPIPESAFTLEGAATINTTTKKFGAGALDCTNSGAGPSADFAAFGDVGNLGADDFTISQWVYTTNNANNIFSCKKGISSQISWLLWNVGGTFYFYFTTDGSTFLNRTWAWQPNGTPTWEFLRLIRSGDDLDLYVDGVKIGTTQSLAGVTIYEGTAPLRVGADNANDTNELLVDDFEVANIARSGAEVPSAEIVADENTVVYSKFNETP